MIDPGFEGKTDVIIGEDHGIGAATAKSLAAQGTKVFTSLCPSSSCTMRMPVQRDEGSLLTNTCQMNDETYAA